VRLGAHESIAGGLHRAFERASSVGCDSVQLFVKPNRSWAVPVLTQEAIAEFKSWARTTGIWPAVGHTSYLLNLCSPQDDLWHKSLDTLVVELQRCEALGLPWLVLHPGAHVGSGEEAGLSRMALALSEVHAATRGYSARLLLETTAGQGTQLGHRFEHLGWLLERTAGGERLGICLDTCHVFAAGYDLRTPDGYGATMAEFDSIIGLDRLEVIHLNDSKGELGSRKDRHEHIGEGRIGLDGFYHFLNDPRLAGLPGILETPKSADLHEDRQNLAVLRGLYRARAPGDSTVTS